ncbi:MAG: polysaccharide pyruvyl transferase family protein [Hydrogenophaga sp.]|nr:polysaccharide pyruvyl transferase family protein [Hydrogenophaga sp.]
MNIGILTFHFSDNYGAALQAYALRRWFTQHGHEVQFIDYRPAHIEHGGRLSLPTSAAKLKANLKVIYLAVSAFINVYFGNQGQKEKFVKFRQQCLGVTDGANKTDNEAALANARSFDLIVAGSDQIWSPSQHFGFDPNYFLAFARAFSGRKISYAASFGRDKVSPAEAAQLPALLANFDAVSVRETSGLGLVEQAGGPSPVNVPDPTLLHSDYSQLVETVQPRQADPYVFCYALRSPDNIRQTAELVAREMGIRIILSPHNPHRRWVEIGQTVHPDPAEWVALLKNARFVVTNSFHGTVFSLLFHKPFIVAGLTGEKATANARALNLLRSVGLEHRFSPVFSNERVAGLAASPIDWPTVDAQLEALRHSGQQFLKSQLELAAQ